MVKIYLNSKKYPGLYALVDDAAIVKFPELLTRKWSPSASKTLSDGTKVHYAVIKGSKNYKRYSIFMHNLIFSPKEGLEVDHIDHNGLNNTEANIRLVSNLQNNYRRKKQRNGSSKYKGVCFINKRNKWVAQIGYDYNVYHLGYFDNEEDAAKAYDKKAKELFKEDAYLNFKE